MRLFVHQVHKVFFSITGACDSFGNHRCVQYFWWDIGEWNVLGVKGAFNIYKNAWDIFGHHRHVWMSAIWLWMCPWCLKFYLGRVITRFCDTHLGGVIFFWDHLSQLLLFFSYVSLLLWFSLIYLNIVNASIMHLALKTIRHNDTFYLSWCFMMGGRQMYYYRHRTTCFSYSLTQSVHKQASLNQKMMVSNKC